MEVLSPSFDTQVAQVAEFLNSLEASVLQSLYLELHKVLFLAQSFAPQLAGLLNPEAMVARLTTSVGEMSETIKSTLLQICCCIGCFGGLAVFLLVYAAIRSNKRIHIPMQ